MAITILSGPQKVMPVYNPIYFKVSSDKTAEEAFNFVFDIYIRGNYITRERLLPRPGVDYTIFSPARILESYLSYDLSENYIGSSANTNCMLDYKIVFGEEYVNPWSFTSNRGITGGTYDGLTEFYSTGTTANPYVSGDTVYVVQDSGFSSYLYNGTFQVLSSTTSSVIVDKTHSVNTPINPGLIYYSDRRKTIFTGATQYLNNPTMNFSLASDWSTYGPDGCNVVLGVDVFNKLTFEIPDVSCATNNQTSFNSNSGLTPGAFYVVYVNVNNINNPSGNDQSITPILGGTPGTPIIGTGFTSQLLQCGTGNTFGLNFYMDADTSGFGTHSESVNYCAVENLNLFSAYTFNGVLSYEKVPVWDYQRYNMEYSTGQASFLTNRPTYVDTKLEDRGTIGMMYISTGTTNTLNYYLVVNTELYDGSPTIPIPFLINQFSTGSTVNTENTIIEFGCYPWNLNQLSQQVYSIDIIDYTVKNYYIKVYVEDPINDPGNLIPFSERKFFNLDVPCSKYDDVRFMFMNRLGQFDFYTANLVSRKNINVTRNTYTQTLPYNYVQGDRGKTVISLDAQETYTVVSDWMSEQTSDWLTEIFTSPEVYILDNDTGAITPIVIDNATVEQQKKNNGQLINYTFEYSKAVMINTQRN